MTDRSTQLKLGAFVALGLLALGGLVILFGGNPRYFSDRVQYTVTFPEAPGIGVGTPVRKSGVRVGEVRSVKLDDDSGEVYVGVDLTSQYRPRDSDEATIGRGLLSGDTTLDFVPRVSRPGKPVPRGDTIPPGTTIAGVPPITPGNIIKEATDAIPNARENVDRVVASIQRFEQAVPRLEKAADEVAGLARGGREFVPELRATNTKVQELIGTNIDVPAGPDQQPVTVRAALQEIVDLLKTIRPAADDLRVLVRDNGPELKQTLQSIRRTSDSVNEVLTPENKRAVAATLKNAQTGSDDLVRTIRLAGILADQAEKTVREINARVAQAEATIAGVNRVVANAERATKPIADAAPGVVTDVQSAAKNVAQAGEQVNAAIAEIRKLVSGFTGQATGGSGTVQKLISDPGLYNNLNQTVVNVNQVIIRLDKVTRDLEVFADKVARRPESLGVSGIVRPNTGLKEPPTQPLPPTTATQPPIAPTVLLPLAPGMEPPGLRPIAPVPLGPATRIPEPVRVRKPEGDLPPR